jgi:hypothetical protein
VHASDRNARLTFPNHDGHVASLANEVVVSISGFVFTQNTSILRCLLETIPNLKQLTLKFTAFIHGLLVKDLCEIMSGVSGGLQKFRMQKEATTMLLQPLRLLLVQISRI